MKKNNKYNYRMADCCFNCKHCQQEWFYDDGGGRELGDYFCEDEEENRQYVTMDGICDKYEKDMDNEENT